MIESNIYLEMILHTNLDLTGKGRCGTLITEKGIETMKKEL